MTKKQADIVQEETSGDVVPPAENIVSKEEEEVAPPEPTIEERIATLRDEFKGTIEEKDRNWQSVANRAENLSKDLSRARSETTQWQQQAQSAQAELDFVKQTQGIDPEELRVRKLEHEIQQLREKQQAASVPPHHRLPSEGRALIRFYKVDPSDTRIDYATDVNNYDEGMDRLEKSLERIKAEEGAKKEEAVQASMEEAGERLKADKGLVQTPKVDPQGVSGGKKSFDDLAEAYSKDPDKYQEEYAKARAEQGF